MLKDCIDPEAGSWIGEITEKSIPEILTFDSLDLSAIEEALTRHSIDMCERGGDDATDTDAPNLTPDSEPT
jgi:hypothetical protein